MCRCVSTDMSVGVYVCVEDVCRYVSVCGYTCVCVGIYMCGDVYGYVCGCVSGHMCPRICTCLCGDMCTEMCVCVHKSVWVKSIQIRVTVPVTQTPINTKV